MPIAALSSRPPHQVRSPRISLRRRLRAIFRTLLDFARELFASAGYRRSREDFLEAAAREARERNEAIDASVGAMSAADIRRIGQHAPAEAGRR